MQVGLHISDKNTKNLKEVVLPMLLNAAKETNDSIKLLQH
jgi:hypothetical protein